ncbi:aminotransferase class I/II-fold pyridoxal phosphate-dependent enzyme [Paenibacillus mesophilus]|uniref:aminotransferase class I/II-fold pyridoxal phosphate-dependent enzyme n=1 Tax=Paenibacillus mesophilus TaxID=2582849 RepID=UPI00110F589B|nr:aminotransferase class I/II-fold pyridoxal phosphate-dependent enzyme [Paenibacillus mesophilus]TMV44723.1 aminotransferase class I/II-fold pyridoxal phosphate-dependent enzyme [Paenibacillus mesophilus]
MKRFGSSRLQLLGSAIFSEVGQWRREAEAVGHDIIDLGIGSPDRPPSERVMESLAGAVRNPANYGYPTSEGTLEFRSAVARWYDYRFGVKLDPEHEVTTLMGSQDGLAHLAMAVCDPGDTAIVPDPGYPIYAVSLVLAGVTPHLLPLRAENGFLPRLDEIPEQTAAAAKFILLGYPSNPLSAVADIGFYEELVEFAKRRNMLIIHDAAYSEMAFDGFRPRSVLEVPGAKEIAVEFHSLSKSFNLAGCRIAFLVGNKDAVGALRALKSNIDYGVFTAVQEAGIAALEDQMAGSGWEVASVYERRRNIVVDGLREVGWNVSKPKATMFIWAPVPPGWTSRQISREILLSAGVVVIPGDAFGEQGQGFVRIALVQEEERLMEAVRRIGRFLRDRGVGPAS